MTFRFLLISSFILSASFYTHASAQKIAVAGGSITEIIYKFGEQDRIVGVDSTSKFPAAATSHPLLGYVRNVSVEGLLSLKPDLFIGEPDTGPTKAIEQIKAVGINTVIIKKDDTIAALQDKIRTVAELLDVKDKGVALLNEIQVDLDALSYATQNLPSVSKTTPPKVLFLLGVRNGTPIAGGHTTSANTAIIEAGGVNVLANEEGWIKLSPESALVLNPDVIVVMNLDDEVLQEVEELPHFQYTNAIKNKALHTINGIYLLTFGPRTPQAIVELGTMIHPNFPLPAGYKFRYANHGPETTGQEATGH